MESMSEERLEVLLMFLADFQDEIAKWKTDERRSTKKVDE